MSNVLSCWYDIYLNGEEISFSTKEQILSISITDSANGCSTAQIIINDINFEIIEDDIFIEDVPIKIEGGWNECIHKFNFEGYIAAIDINFGAEGFPVVTLNLIDATHLMNRESKYRTWGNTTSGYVVSNIAREYGFNVKFNPIGYEFAKEETITQSDMTDIQFLRQLADRESDMFTCYLMSDRQTIFYGIRGALDDPVIDLWYRSNSTEIISFNPKINRETVQKGVEVADIDTAVKTNINSSVNTNNAVRDVQGSPISTSNTPKRTGGTGNVWNNDVNNLSEGSI